MMIKCPGCGYEISPFFHARVVTMAGNQYHPECWAKNEGKVLLSKVALKPLPPTIIPRPRDHVQDVAHALGRIADFMFVGTILGLAYLWLRFVA